MPEVKEERYIRLRDGTIYGYTPLLAKRRDAVIVDDYAAAQWYRSQGITNELTEKYPNAPAARLSARAEEQTVARTFINQRAIAAKVEEEQKQTERRAKLQKLKANLKAAEEGGSDGKDGS